MPRLFVIFARDEPTAVILRRGPSAWYHLISWNTANDTFSHGAWFRGRIFEDKCDLSPDGQLFLYSVHKPGQEDPTYSEDWTALSRPPWLFALTLWPQGTTRGGGGRFVDSRQIVLCCHERQAHPNHPLRGLELVSGTVDYQESSDEVPEADWCGRDQQGRLVFSFEGELLHRDTDQDRLIADFTDLYPAPQPAPDWARLPLEEINVRSRRPS